MQLESDNFILMIATEADINNLCEHYLLAPDNLRREDMLTKIEALVEYYLTNNFIALIQLLYRVDVSEARINTIAENKILDARIIAELILERIIEKLKHRTENTLPKEDTTTDAIDLWE